jgi:hypothetical protein
MEREGSAPGSGAGHHVTRERGGAAAHDRAGDPLDVGREAATARVGGAERPKSTCVTDFSARCVILVTPHRHPAA